MSTSHATERWWSCLICAAACLAIAANGHAAEPIITLDFDTGAGTRIDEQYAAQGVHFLNDYRPGRYRSSPLIVGNANARSAPNVLENSFLDDEIYSSSNVPMVLWFDQPVTGVGMWLGTTKALCSAQATVSTYTCNGSHIKSETVTVSDAFNTPLEIDDPLERIQKVVIDYGDSTCPEAIDDFAFQVGTGICTDNTAPQVTITSHGISSVVNNPDQTLEGTVVESGMLKSVKVDGSIAKFYLSFGVYHFNHRMTLQQGSQTVTATAEDVAGNKGSDQTTLTVGTPSTATLLQFHLTQRGLMKNSSCDVDVPLVAGKTAIVRINLGARTTSGADTYVDSVKLILKRKQAGGDVTVQEIYGGLYAPQPATFHSPSHMSGIHFYLPGGLFDPEGQYRFEFQPYVGTTALGSSPLVADCGGTYFSFLETNPIRLYIMPVEAALSNPNHPGEHVVNYHKQLHTVGRTYPIRDGFSRPWDGMDTGIIYVEGDPMRLCDGTTSTEKYAWCEGTGWQWRLTDKDSSGKLRRANHTVTFDFNDPSICDPTRPSLGGRALSDVIADDQHTIEFVPQLGLFRGGAHPQWFEKKHYIPIDEDHDGHIDEDDYQHFIEEFFDLDDGTTPEWTTDLSRYDQGETYRHFEDQDGDHCQSRDADGILSEPQADIVRLWENANKLRFKPSTDAMNAWNQQSGPVWGNMEYSGLWFPVVVNPQRGDFGTWGPGTSSGTAHWIRVVNDQTAAHELGHSLGGLADLYAGADCDIPGSRLTAWAAYADFKSMDVTNIWEVMSCSSTPERYFFNHANYSQIFTKLRPAPDGADDTADVVFSAAQAVVNGWIYFDGPTATFRVEPASGLALTPTDPASPYRLVFGSGLTELAEHPFAVDDREIHWPEGYPEWDLPFTELYVVAGLPAGTEWIELRREAQVLDRFDRSASPPTVEVLSPNGGEYFGPYDEAIIRWALDDPDGSDLNSTVYYSPDDVNSWIVIATGVSGTELPWNLGDAPGTEQVQGRIRVETTDGYHTAQDESDGPFEIAGKPPATAILVPDSGQTYLQCERIRLEGVATDPEAQPLSLTWYVDGMAAGSEPRGELDRLAPGVHHIQLVAEDNDGFDDTAEVWITVLADLDCDGMSDAFEDAHGLDSGLAGDAALDGDMDGLMNFDEAWYGTKPDDPDTDGDGDSDGDEVASGSSPLDPDDTLNRAPVADAGPDQRIECGGAAGGSVELDGSASYDPDGDSLSCRWSSLTCTFDDPSACVTSAACPPGNNAVTLIVSDGTQDSSPSQAVIRVVDSFPPTGGITAPADGSCHGGSVTVEDDFTDICDAALDRTYSPGPGGPTYNTHGDYDVTLTVEDDGGNTAQDTVSFSIDTTAPEVDILRPPSEAYLPRTVPFTVVFSALDDDGATGGPVHEVIEFAGCTLYDGATYGDGDGLLSDETLEVTVAELCRLWRDCGFEALDQPELRVEATDCGGNVGADVINFTGSLTLGPSACRDRSKRKAR